MSGSYLAIIVFGLAGMLTIDIRYRLAILKKPKTTLATLAVSVLFFSIWDSAGIAMGIFFEGSSNWLIGINLAPEYPIEEAFFLTLFSYTTLVLYRWFESRNRN